MFDKRYPFPNLMLFMTRSQSGLLLSIIEVYHLLPHHYPITLRLAWVSRFSLSLHNNRHGIGHSGIVFDVAVTPDGRRVTSASFDGTLKVWNLGKSENHGLSSGHRAEVHMVAVTPDGRWVLSGSSDHTTKVWDIQTEKEICTLKGHHGEVHAVVVAPDGRHALTGSSDHTIKLWNLETRQVVRSINYGDEVRAIAVTLDGHQVLAACEEPTLNLWNLQRPHSEAVGPSDWQASTCH